MHFVRKLKGTLKIAYNLIMTRTFGSYIHSVGGPDIPDYAIYEWKGKKWWIPTSEVK